MELIRKRNAEAMNATIERLEEVMKGAGSMKHSGAMRNEINNIRGISYGEGYSAGWDDGYDDALKNTQQIAIKCSIGRSKYSCAEKELRPAVLYMHKLTKRQQLRKIAEELDEVIQAWEDGEKNERVAEELADVQMACETMLAMLGYTEAQRKEIRLAVIDKNSRRGYYMPPRDKYGD